LWRGKAYQHAKIRLAYLSSDFRSHATAHLMAGVFEQHDKSKFEVIALSSHPNDNSEVRRRISSACDRFINIENLTDREVALLIRATEIDIAVDLHGFADNNRLSVFSARPAPVQVSYLGYPGTLGAAFMDYIIADHVVIPVCNQVHYREKVVYLPHSYQPNDSRRPIPTQPSSRTAVGLPETSFVFCCFNNTRKVTAPIFDVWMRLLCACPGSVLWLFADNPDVINNLRREADARGVAPSRLVFAAPTSHTDHLNRYCLADLFLDTLPYNAHTTGSDALWAGLPVLTCMGNTFSGRVAASLLHAAGLSELVTSSLAEYGELALTLARDPDRLSAIKTTLTLNRGTLPLFDTTRYTRNLEAAFLEMWRRLQKNEALESFVIPKPQ
jgi:predicted O-linked N-acetylglucosamine transferase (SPINDLY family)